MLANVTDQEIVDTCGDPVGTVCRVVYESTENRTLAEISRWLIEGPIRILLILVIALIAHRMMRRAVGRLVERLVADRDREREERLGDDLAERLDYLATNALSQFGRRNKRAKQRAETLGAILTSVAGLLIWTLAGLLVLGEVGISLAPLIAGAGIAGIAVGFGAQSLVRDIITGVFIMIEDQYGVDDVVDLGEAVGTVEAVGLRTTRVRDLRGSLWFVPNGEITRVANMSQLWARAILDIEVAYETDISHASEVILDVARSLWEEQLEEATVLEEPIVMGVQELGASGVVIRLAVKTDPSEQWFTSRLLKQRIKDRLDEEGIEIPYPHRTVILANPDQS
ncbi:MAG: mechanosensitive ion channel family protein [Actinomycetia bacterium]|nr:mechanosensitive ion channel family protein [Actinomycetes bacterium]MCP3913190.1 mechanosensitive ion channel family protein [Actinomycetes bacterium]MCP4084956.1 mechanosensitive ion channel family protein [Actinomycetes bacterium]